MCGCGAFEDRYADATARRQTFVLEGVANVVEDLRERHSGAQVEVIHRWPIHPPLTRLVPSPGTYLLPSRDWFPRAIAVASNAAHYLVLVV